MASGKLAAFMKPSLNWFLVFAAGGWRSNWFMGAQLLAVYLILAVAFYFMPG
jgi:hypothetical protein